MAFRCARRLLYFQRSIKHSLSKESKQRLEFTGWKFTTEVRTKCLSHVRSCYKYYVFYIHRQDSIFFKSPFVFGFHTFLHCWCFLFGSAAVGARSWAGVVFSLFPVQTLGELGLERGEVISRSNCKVDCSRRGGSVECCSFPIHSQPHVRYGCSVTNQGLHLSDILNHYYIVCQRVL